MEKTTYTQYKEALDSINAKRSVTSAQAKDRCISIMRAYENNLTTIKEAIEMLKAVAQTEDYLNDQYYQMIQALPDYDIGKA